MRRDEQMLQKSIAAYLDTALPPPPVGPFWTAINPVPAKSKAVAGLSKAMGMKPGVPDFLLVYRGRSHFIEFKAGKGRAVVPQIAVASNLRHHGATYHVCRSLLGMADLLLALDIPLRAKPS